MGEPVCKKSKIARNPRAFSEMVLRRALSLAIRATDIACLRNISFLGRNYAPVFGNPLTQFRLISLLLNLMRSILFLAKNGGAD
jgi:hypothetical protein